MTDRGGQTDRKVGKWTGRYGRTDMQTYGQRQRGGIADSKTEAGLYTEIQARALTDRQRRDNRQTE